MLLRKLPAISAALVFLYWNTASYSQVLMLSDSELAWLAEHPELRIAYDKDFPPVEWHEDGVYQGISIDYIHLIEKQLKIKFRPIEGKNWSQIMQDFRAGEIDILPAIARNDQRERYTLFTKPHISIPGVIVSARQYQNINELAGKKVGVVNDYYWDDLISQYDKELDIVRVETTELGIELTATGAIDAMVSDLASVSYWINKHAIGNLNVVPVPFEKRHKLNLSIGVRKDLPLLLIIMQKAMDNISQQDKEHIYNKHIKLQKIAFWQSSRFWYAVLVIGLIIGVVIVSIFLWNRTLKLQVARRTEQLQKAHAQLMHAEKMQSIGRLSAGVAHEVKNPLAILQMSIDYLKGEKNDEAVSSILNDMDDAVARADNVIKGLLDFSREKDLQVVNGDINEVIEQSLKLIGHELRQRNIKVNTSLSSELPEIGIDKNRLQQVFINLFMNAAHAVDNTGQIDVVSKLSVLDDPWLIDRSEGKFSHGQHVISVDVLDSGCGLAEMDEKEIFEPFFTTKPVGEGTGLGLSVSKTIIGLHGGMIAMRNRADGVQHGAEVKLIFAIKGEHNDEKNIGG
ncbi:MAG: transporter substrate-binding domain-containing protein [Gammaproteobacteria bacterium]|nr:MAG: transporter substrate-binding domain-containing protein [Gammaproteobacteria bacterium]